MPVADFHQFLLKESRVSILLEKTEAGPDYSYTLCVQEALSTINRMLSVMTSSDPDLVADYSEEKKGMSGDLDSSIDSHKEFWSSVRSMASNLEKDIAGSKKWEPGADDEDFKREIESLNKKKEEGTLTDSEWQKKVEKLRQSSKSNQAKILFMEKTKKAFRFFKEAVDSFSDCGESLLGNMKDNDAIMKYATKAAKKILTS